MDYRERITADPAIRRGQPCIKGTRITVFDILEYLAGGMSVDQLLADFPELGREDLQAAFAFTAESGRKTVHLSA